MSKFKEKFNKILENIDLPISHLNEDEKFFINELEDALNNAFFGNPGHDDFKSETMGLFIDTAIYDDDELSDAAIGKYEQFLENLIEKFKEIAINEVKRFKI